MVNDPSQKATVWGPSADPDHDGLTNLQEYAFGTDPNHSDASPVAKDFGKANPGYLTLNYTQRVGDAALVVFPQYSSDLQNWWPTPPLDAFSWQGDSTYFWSTTNGTVVNGMQTVTRVCAEPLSNSPMAFSRVLVMRSGTVAIGSPLDGVNFFDSVSGQVGGSVDSNSVVLSGFAGTVAVSVSGGAHLIVNGVDVGASATVAAGSTLRIRATSPANGASASYTLTLGGTVTRTWNVASRAPAAPPTTPPGTTSAVTSNARVNQTTTSTTSTLHLWWARRPLAACRAVLFASLVDDPGPRPDLYPTPEAQETKRQELFRLIEELVKWENSNKPSVLEAARAEILLSTDGNPPPVYDPFCGGGSIPLEAQRLGLEAHASDLNPVPVLITKALIEIPPKFAGRPPVNPQARAKMGGASGSWPGAAGLAEDVRYYGAWMREQARERIGQLYPPVFAVQEAEGNWRHATPEERAEWDRERGEREKNPAFRGQSKVRELTVIAWLWARTVASPNPAARGAHVPLVRSFWLSTKPGKKAWVEPVIDAAAGTYRFEVRTGAAGEPRGATVGKRGGECLLTGGPLPLDHIRAEGKAGRMGARLLTIVAEGDRGRVYLPPSEEHERVALEVAPPADAPETDLPKEALGFRVQNYGMTKHRHLFTNRQLTALTTFCGLVAGAREKVLADGGGDAPYADAVATYLAFAVGRGADKWASLTIWNSVGEKIEHVFGRNALSMTWDFPEGNIFSNSTGNWESGVEWVFKVIGRLPASGFGVVRQSAAQDLPVDQPVVFSTDPPYYDNVPYADLSDFFYVWLRGCLKNYHPTLLGTLLVPKTEELVADPFRHGNAAKAKNFFEQGIGDVLARMRKASDARYPRSIYYAFKQSEADAESDASLLTHASTGWETFLQGLVNSGWQVDGTWPLRTERPGRLRDQGSNALASSIVLVCRPRPTDAGIASRRDFLSLLKRELPEALRHLQKGNIAPVDLAQAAIGPGMAVFSRFKQVLEADGEAMPVRTALALINQTLDETLAEQEGEFDAGTRWAVTWFNQYGFAEGPYGTAETLATARNTAVGRLAEEGLVLSKAGKVRLLRAEELAAAGDGGMDARTTIWEATHRLVRALDLSGEEGTAEAIAHLGGERAELARDLSYRLFTLCERNKWAREAMAYNALVGAWSEASRLAISKPPAETFTQREML